MRHFRKCVVLGLLAAATVLPAAPERYRLYTQPDATCSGGMQGHIVSPKLPIKQILAIPPDEPRFVYEGKVTGSSQSEFSFGGLPMRKYDLVVIYEEAFYEGLQLHRSESNLTTEDLKQIDDIVQKSEPFFTHKTIHRVAGETGRGNLARCVCTFYSAKDAEGGHGRYRRTFRLLMLKQVGPGWQFVRSRDLYPLWVEPALRSPKHNFRPQLSRIRVTDYVKDLGDINLGR